MGFLTAILTAAQKIAPYAISFVKNGGAGVAKDIAEGRLAMAGAPVYNSSYKPMAGANVLTQKAIRMMGPEDPNTVQQIDIAINSALDAEQTLDWYQDTVRQRMQILAPYLANSSVTEVQTLNASIELVFGKETKVVTENGKTYTCIGPNDHGYFHCIPNVFDGWEKMKNYEMFSVVAMLCTDEQGNEFGTSSVTKFLPVSINTENIPNDRLANIDSGVTADKNSISQFLSVLMSGNQYKFDYNKETKGYNNLRPCFANVNSNPIFYTDYVNDLFKDNSQCISFGTFVFMRPNFSNTELTVRYKIKMFVVGISQSSSYNLTASQNPAPEPEPTPDPEPKPDDNPDDKPDDGDDKPDDGGNPDDGEKPDDGNDGDDGSAPDGTSPVPTSCKPTSIKGKRIRGRGNH